MLLRPPASTDQQSVLAVVESKADAALGDVVVLPAVE